MEEIIKKCLPTYEVIRKIGEGVYGTVFHVRDNLKERAVKVVPIMVERSLSYRTQKELDSKISHDFHAVQAYYGKIKGEGVIEIHDFHLMDKIVSNHQAKAYLIILMEVCPENLANLVLDNYPLPPVRAKRLMRELAEILNRLSNRTVDAFIVKDLKPSNLLINKEGRMVIGDLGGVQRISSVSTSAHAQFTPNWSAPELIIKNEPAGVASLIYSYGFVSYFIWSGALPYENMDFTERIRKIKEQGLAFNRKDMPYFIQGLIDQCLKFNSAERPANFMEIIKVLDGEKRYTIEEQISVDVPSVNDDRKAAPAESIKIHEDPKNMRQPAVHKMPGDMYKSGDTWEEPVTGMEFSWVPSGSFRMGCGNWDGEGNKDEFPVHEIYIDGFWMGKYPVTQEQWEAVMSNPFLKKVRPNNPSWFKMGKDHPVDQVSWNDAQECIQKLISVNKGKYHFRLPTEAEWEYAARSGGQPHKYAGGKNFANFAWYSANSGMISKPVGQKLPNALGIFDMSGNVYEWCLDIYSESAYKKHDKENPVITADGIKRVIRGGSWSNSPHELRCAYRASVNQEFKGNYIGFRLVMTPVSRKKIVE
ncbi:MAG: SUMF1/EgtB/PvdO family nonheme iron enzyme [Desulfobacterales bacterium]|jgi:formylglycine-generating enzyme required for sulfatase activity|nr:SUMF1/EgtB/PvdO family nonheme iron enzyme [Desulfobacterales bacterium]